MRRVADDYDEQTLQPAPSRLRPRIYDEMEEKKDEQVTQMQQEMMVVPPQNDWLAAIYQVFLFGAHVSQELPKRTPALAVLGPEVLRGVDDASKVGITVFDTAAKVAGTVWGWKEARNFINDTITSIIMPEEQKTFELLYTRWLDEVVMPIRQGEVTEEKIAEVVEKFIKENKVEKPKEFIMAVKERLERDTGAKSSSILDLLSRERPYWRRKKTPTARVKLG